MRLIPREKFTTTSSWLINKIEEGGRLFIEMLETNAETRLTKLKDIEHEADIITTHADARPSSRHRPGGHLRPVNKMDSILDIIEAAAIGCFSTRSRPRPECVKQAQLISKSPG